MNINQLLMAQHREAEKLFEELEEAEPEQRRALSTALAAKLEMHMELEEQIVYPAIRRLVEGSDRDVAEAGAEHELVRRGIEQLLALDADTPGFDGLIAMLKAGVLHHVEEEEKEVLPNLAESATKHQLEELARQCQERIVRAGGRSPAIDAEAATRDELYDRAREADIDGRSDMTKEELAAALEHS